MSKNSTSALFFILRMLERYVEALNALHPPPLWWSCVAYPALRHMWSQ